MPIRTLVVDDEPLARRRLARLLGREEDVEIVGTSGGGPDAVELIRTGEPDLVLLDVQMPEMSGFDVIRAVGPERMPLVVFVTAYDEFAVQAFEVRAVDYLLKPYRPERLAEAVHRARTRLASRSWPDPGRLATLLERIQSPPPEPEAPPQEEPPTRPLSRIWVKQEGRMFFVPVPEIDWLEAEGNYVRLHRGKQSHLVRSTLSQMEARLDADRFLRIHRSTIVNIDRIREIQPWFGGDYLVLLTDGMQLKLSRNYRLRLSELVGL